MMRRKKLTAEDIARIKELGSAVDRVLDIYNQIVEHPYGDPLHFFSYCMAVIATHTPHPAEWLEDMLEAAQAQLEEVAADTEDMH